jgi:uncharacterized protein
MPITTRDDTAPGYGPRVRVLYLHGLGSWPGSTKGRAFAAHFAARGIAIDRLDLRVPSLAHLRLSAMIATTTAALADRTILIGSSLGGLTAAHVARDPRVVAVVLLAPAFKLVRRWRAQLGAAWDDWQRTGWREIHDFEADRPARLDFAFTEDIVAVDRMPLDPRAPTLILHGTADDVVPIECSRAVAASRPNAQLVELADDHGLVASLPIILPAADAFLAPWLPPAA